MTWLITQQMNPRWIRRFLFLRDVFYAVTYIPNFGPLTKNLGPFLSQLWVDGVVRWRANDDVEDEILIKRIL